MDNPRWKQRPPGSNWGDFGPDDQIGRMNLLTPQMRLKAIREVFGDRIPHIQSTKSLTGHSLGAAGVQESIYSLLMMQAGFIGESAHITELDPEFDGVAAPLERQQDLQALGERADRDVIHDRAHFGDFPEIGSNRHIEP